MSRRPTSNARVAARSLGSAGETRAPLRSPAWIVTWPPGGTWRIAAKFFRSQEQKPSTRRSARAVRSQSVEKSGWTNIAAGSEATAHAVASPIAAHVRAVVPTIVCVVPRSCKMRARTGNAVMLSEISDV